MSRPYAIPSLILLLASTFAQQPAKPRPPASTYAVFSKVETSTLPTGMDLTVVCSKPVSPGFTQLQNPDRLVIDLPDTLVGNHPNTVPIGGADVRAMRINQFQRTPPIARIVLDLAGERAYSFEQSADPNSFVVHLRSASAAAAPPSKPAVVVEGTVGVGLPHAMPAASPAAPAAATRATLGSAITAGSDTTIMHLDRGGEIRICPGTTASITPSQNGRSLMTGMSEGAVELHYSLAASADTVLTPDFRILLSGPGEFHYAISADPKGNTCVRALQGNTASAVVSELMGDGTYQVKPGEQVVFRGGRLNQTDANVPLECGCPPPRQQQMLASTPVEVGNTKAIGVPTDKPDSATTPSSPDIKPNSPVMAEVRGITTPTSSKPQVTIDAPFVFRASDMPPDVSHEVTNLPPGRAAHPLPLPAVTSPRKTKKTKLNQDKLSTQGSITQTPPPAPKPAAQPAPPPPQKPDTFLGKVKNFFQSIFK